MLVQMPSGVWISPKYVVSVELVPATKISALLGTDGDCYISPHISVITEKSKFIAKSLQLYKEEAGQKNAEIERDDIAKLLNI